MSIWNWVLFSEARAQWTNDAQRLRLAELRRAGMENLEKDPDRALSLLDEARALAVELGENWWVLFLDHWRLQVLINYKRDFRSVLEIAVRATLESRKPSYAELPQRICLHEDLINAYAGIDPLGYRDRLEEALQYIEAEVADDVECRFCVRNCRIEHELAQDRSESAEASARVALKMAEEEHGGDSAVHHYHSAAACKYLCIIAQRRGDWRALEEWAALGRERACMDEQRMTLVEMLAWRALAARQRNDEDAAQSYQRGAARRLARIGSAPSEHYFNALCAYHEAAGDLKKAAKARQRECDLLKDKGRYHFELRARLELARLLQELGKPIAQELSVAEELMQHVKDPSSYQGDVAALRERG